MRTLATRLGVVPGALYHNVHNKEQLHDLVLDGAGAELVPAAHARGATDHNHPTMRRPTVCGSCMTPAEVTR
jgi:AcrR family transcriptional regulator